MYLLNNHIQDIEVPGTRQFANRVDQYPNCLDLTLGQSDFPVASYVQEAMVEAIQAGQLKYTHNKGLIELRKAISEYNASRFGVKYNPETEIVVTNGASEGIDDVLRTILNPGDEVILPGPTYLGYEPIVKLQGAEVKWIDTSHTGFVPTAEAIKAAITPKTKAVMFNYPTNPTGMTLSYAQIRALVEVLKETSVFIITDEIYSENVFEGRHHSFMEFPEIREQLFVVNGLSKSHAMTGARVGYVLSTPELIEEVTTVHLYNSICVATPSQYGAIRALKEGNKDIQKMNAAYRERRDYIYARLVDMGLPVTLPQGTFYIFPDVSAYDSDSFRFCNQLLETEQLAIVPGKSFSDYAEGYVRLSFACDMETIKEACDRLEHFISHYEK
ncbi:N-acetyl-L,L-diaminopimelate aminotransferase [Staphylococcus schleiferi]|uniref:aminotransferase class I/II-fold pyridoxal phosphate-dependent enzyme n=1 Tax=Staphylococcus coagulans TaxID=74706 RepID=UPI00067A0D14|nr:aminotransferase class I/II-fold pyridoxal phosphate-dependent enzyme [Staphylococcus coagulans]AKS68275.1 N-acetyl-L,L-diaminopimelate aminotransferase [Staphylococcus schleiferi]AKS70503.1 N-acetyl-L,L-diaminopimelate aminotransferase [Staphylococcus schleiferi]AKS72652.1 N-acetyl-L,L-diaminopimelate aminotransferase [Staphylococcus schleiferi]MBA8764459.1 aminotransferase class I/II-fold pyridoxal phosphate-dependent enzyme [Staphylococcus coagulans]MBT2809920.1 aminotransferase class I/